MRVMPTKKRTDKKPATFKPFPSSGLIIDQVEDLRKVLGIVTLLASRGSIADDGCDPKAILGSYELIEDHLCEIHQALESAMDTLDEASAQYRTINAPIYSRNQTMTVHVRPVATQQ